TLKVNQVTRLQKPSAAGGKAVLETSSTPAVEVVGPSDQSRVMTGADSPVKLKWKAQSLQDEFDVEVSRDESFLRPIVKKTVQGDELDIPGGNLSGRYFWKVTPKNSPESGRVRAFTASKMEAPTPILPRNDAILALESKLVDQKKIARGAEKAGALRVRMEWKDWVGAPGFKVELSEDPAFSKPIAQLESSGASVEFPDVKSGQYYWRVKAQGGTLGNTLPWSRTSAFKVVEVEPEHYQATQSQGFDPDAIQAINRAVQTPSLGTERLPAETAISASATEKPTPIPNETLATTPTPPADAPKVEDMKTLPPISPLMGTSNVPGTPVETASKPLAVVSGKPSLKTAVPTPSLKSQKPPAKKLALKTEPAKPTPPSPAIKTVADLIGPEDNDYFGLRDGKNEIPLAWSEVTGAKGYLVEVSKTPDFKTIIKSQSLKDQNYTLRGIPEGKYHWRVTPTLNSGKVGNTSKTSSFNVVPDAKLPPPKLRNKTMRIEVRNEIRETPLPEKFLGKFSWTSLFISVAEAQSPPPKKSIPLQWNPVPNAAHYRLQISRDKEFNKVVLDTDVNGLEFKWFDLKPGQFFWRVGGVTTGNREGEWSEIASIEVALAAPKASDPKVFQQKVTDKGALGLPPKPVLLDWNADSNAKFYELKVAPTKDFKEAKSYLSNTNSTEVQVPKPGDYFYQVRALDDSRKPISNYSEPSAFQVLTELALPQPPAPELKPTNVDVGFNAKNNVVKFNWPTVEGAKGYRIEISRDENFETQLNSQDVTTNSYELKDLPEGKVHWRVRAHDEEKTSDWSKGDFNLKPKKAVLTPPSLRGELARIAITADDSALSTFQWDAVEGAEAYRVEISDTPDFKRIVSSGYTKQNFAKLPLQNSRDYYWRVACVDGLPQDSAQIAAGQILAGEPSRSGKIRIQPGESFSVGLNLGMGSTSYQQTSSSTEAPAASGNSAMGLAFGLQSDYWFPNDTGLRFDFSSLSRKITLRSKEFAMNQLDAGLRGQIRFRLGGKWSLVVGAGLAYRPIQAVLEKTAGSPTLQEARGISWNQQLDFIAQSASARSMYRIGVGSMQSLTNVFGGFVLKPQLEARFRFGSFWAGAEAYYVQDP
ncbi:MAG: hypothetical protein K2X47_18600, partial [Bdellovibrionales bacterium]|nr:hypothetical protein [Bdellovibrionales bacterium]